MIDLTLVSMDDMVKEIRNRFDTVVIITRKQTDKENDLINHNFKDNVGCIGLIRIADERLKTGYNDEKTGTFNE